jgi:capsid protein
MPAKRSRPAAKKAPGVKLSRQAAEALSAGRLDERVGRILQATWNAAATSERNENLWVGASGRSADAENAPGVRTTIRNRCRYEARNNSFCRGIIDTKSSDVVGRVPRLQLFAAPTDEAALKAAEVKEAAFAAWAENVRLGQRLRLLFVQRMESGEGFIVLRTNDAIDGPVKLDPILVEADRVTSSFTKVEGPTYCDGITYDALGNPVSYDVMKDHPGSDYVLVGYTGEYETVPVSRCLHYFRATRPGQRRGVADIAPALNLFGMLRRWSMAVLNSAETAAHLSWLLTSQGGPNIEPVEIDPMDTIDLTLGTGLTMPAGWEPKQLKAEQPTANHQEYLRCIINEIARGQNMPMNVALGDSSDYNYASGRLDYQVYFRDISVNRHDLGVTILTPIFKAWDREYRVAMGEAPGPAEPHEWFFDGTEHVDPAKEANAEQTKLASKTLTYRDVFSRKGQDWREAFKQMAAEEQYMDELGIKPQLGNAPAGPAPNPPKSDDGEDGNGNGDGDGSLEVSGGKVRCRIRPNMQRG